MTCQYVDMQYSVGDAKVVNSRYFKGQNVVWRRRKSLDGFIFTTRERIDLSSKIVRKRNQKPSESYQPAKLLTSLTKALSHRKDAYEVSWELLFTIENKICVLDEIYSVAIAQAALDILRSFDVSAYISYAQHQQDLVKPDDIVKALNSVSNQ